MIQVNLLPVRAQKRREHVRQFVSAYFLSIVLLFSVMGYLWLSCQNEVQGLERRSSQVSNEVNQYSKYDAMLKELESKKAVSVKKRSIIHDLQNDRDKVARVLTLLSVELPADKVWFERLAISGSSITLNGVALSNEAIAEFMRNLESSPYTVQGSVNLVLSRQVARTNMKLREFQLACQFMPFSAIQEKLEQKTTESPPKATPADKT